MTRFADFDLSTITFGAYSRGINVSLPNGDPIQFQIPRLYAPFGVSGFQSQFGPTRYNLDGNMKGWDAEGSYVNKFYKFLTTIETIVIEHVRKGGFVEGEPNEFFNSNIKMSEKFDPKFRIKVDTSTKFFDSEGGDMTPPELSEGLFKGKTFTGLVQLKSVYFFKRQIGLTWTLVEAKMFEPKRVHGPRFIKDSEVTETPKPSSPDSWAGKVAQKKGPMFILDKKDSWADV